MGALNASSPAYAHGRLYIVHLVPGQVLELDANDGKTIWKRSLPGRAESSPLVIDGKVYFGCRERELYALDATTATTLDDDPGGRGQGRRPPTRGTSTSATTAAT